MHEALQYKKNEDSTVTCSLCNHRCTIKEGRHGICGVRKNEQGTLFAETYGRISAEGDRSRSRRNPCSITFPAPCPIRSGGSGATSIASTARTGISPGQHWKEHSCGTSHPKKVLSGQLQAGAQAFRGPTMSRRSGMSTRSTWAGSHGQRARYDLCNKRVHHRGSAPGTCTHARGIPGGYQVILGCFLQKGLRGAPAAGSRLGSTCPRTGDAYRDGHAGHPRPERRHGRNFRPDPLGDRTSGSGNTHAFLGIPSRLQDADRGATPLATLEKIYTKAKELGLKYPYMGNVYNHRYENTYCPVCGATLIERHGFSSRFRTRRAAV